MKGPIPVPLETVPHFSGLCRPRPPTSDCSARIFTPRTSCAKQREPWLVIDPKPFVGDPTYDALQHHLNSQDRLVSDPVALASRMAGLLGLDVDRLLLWLFAYCVVQSVDFPWMLGVAEQIRP